MMMGYYYHIPSSSMSLLLVYCFLYVVVGTDATTKGVAAHDYYRHNNPSSSSLPFFALQNYKFPNFIPLHSPGMVDNCTELYIKQKIDHFSPKTKNGTYFQQRYFINDDFYDNGEEGPMLFYLGNEADVTLYVNATGLMWENAPNLNALIVFAEHRYYGKSQVTKEENPPKNLQYLSAEQAIMDYVYLIDHLKTQYNFSDSQAVIGFGGKFIVLVFSLSLSLSMDTDADYPTSCIVFFNSVLLSTSASFIYQDRMVGC